MQRLRAVGQRVAPAICNAAQRAPFPPHPSFDGRAWWLGVSATVPVQDDQRLRGHLPRYTLGVRGFYRRPLPSPPAIPFASAEGKQMFKEALELGGMEGYFRASMQPRPSRSCLPQQPASALPMQVLLEDSRAEGVGVATGCAVAGLAGQFVTQMEPAFCGLVRASFLPQNLKPEAPGVKGALLVAHHALELLRRMPTRSSTDAHCWWMELSPPKDPKPKHKHSFRRETAQSALSGSVRTTA